MLNFHRVGISYVQGRVSGPTGIEAEADGTTIRRAVSECHISLPQGDGHTPVVLGQPGDPEALLGVVTLEMLGLVLDPFRRTLHPMRALLA